MEISEQLRRSVDDHPVVVPDLLPRARAARRRRTAVAAAAAASVVAAGIFGISQVLPSDVPVAVPAESGEPTHEVMPHDADAPVPHDVIVERCLPQVAQYRQWIMFENLPETGYSVAFPERDYRPGEPVRLHASGYDQFTCLLPEVGEEIADVIAALTPRLDDPALVTALCSEQQFGYEGRFGGERRITYEGEDLRGAEIVVGAEADGLVNVVLSQDGRRYACNLAPQNTDLGVSHTSLVTDEVFGAGSWDPFGSIVATGAAGKSIVPGDHAYYLCSHQAPDGVRSIEVSGQVAGTVEVREDGLFACVLKGDAPEAITGAAWVAKDAEGNVVAEGGDH